MKLGKKITTVLLSVFICEFSTNFLFGEFEVKLVERIVIPKNEDLSKTLTLPLAFYVTGDGVFIIPDYEAGNIKVYEEVGGFLELVNTIGRKGFGVGDLQEPKYGFYDETESELGVIDYGLRKIFIYERVDRMKFICVQEFPCLRLGYDIQLAKKDIVLVSGAKIGQDGKSYGLYCVALKNDYQAMPLLPLYKNFGFASDKEYKKQMKDISKIGTKSWFDIYEDNIYFVWEGDLRILKLNIEGGEPTYFGKKTSNYTKPSASEELKSALIKEDYTLIQNEKSKMSFVRNIFVTSKYVLLVYEGPGKQDFTLQFYTLDGDYLNEIALPSTNEGQPDSRLVFDKNRGILYSLSSEVDKHGEHFYILKYKINL
jgi:hypothetical protein